MSANRLAVPAYFHPALTPGDWAQLAASAGRLRAVVLNIDSGPGSAREPAWYGAAHRLVANGVSLLGYVDTDYGRRPERMVRADVARYRSWYPVTGIFLDQVASQAPLLAWYDRIVTQARTLGATTIVLNHGVYPDPRYGGLADALVTFEGAWPAYRRLSAPDWAREHAPERFWHLVYRTPDRLLAAALRRAAACHVATVYVTERAQPNPWDALPANFGRQARLWASL